MAQHDYSIANAGGATVRSDINDALAAILSQNSGATEPAVTAPFMPWYDTTAGALKIRNAANTSWVLYSDFALPNDAVTADKIAAGAVGTSEIADDAVTAGKIADGAVGASELATAAVTAAKLANQGAELGMRNRIINGAMVVDQRFGGALTAIPAGAALAYRIDRWYVFCTGAEVTGQQIAVSGPSRYRFTGAASNTGVGFGQRIEAQNSRDMAGSTATLSVKLSSSSLTSVGWAAYYANTTNSFGTLASPNRTLIASGTFTINATEATYSASMSVPSAATTGIEIVFTGGALLGSQTLVIGDVQLERGSVASPFEFRPFGTELSLCQRYYLHSSEYCFSGYAPSANSYFQQTFTLPVPMRVLPTIGLGLFSGSTNVSSPGAAGLRMSVSSLFGPIGCYAAVFGWTAPNAGYTAYNLYFDASAEL
jgi:hypothetical protein